MKISKSLLLTEIVLVLTIAVCTTRGSYLHDSTRLYYPDEDFFEGIITSVSKYHLLLRWYLDSFFVSLGFQKKTDDFKVVHELYTALKGQGSVGSGKDGDAIDRVIYGGSLSKINITIPPAFQNKTASCKLCLGIVAVLRLAVKKTNYTFVENIAIKSCKTLVGLTGGRAEELCEGTIKLLGPHVERIVTQPITIVPKICPYLNACTSSDDPSLLEELESGDDGETVKEGKKDGPKEKVKGGVKEVLNGKKNSKNQNAVLKIVQIADIHIEKRYKEGTATYCGLPVCCIEKWGKGEAGRYGDYKCNVPERTVEIFLQKISNFNPDAILFTGDVSPHTMWDETFDSQMNCTETAAKLFGNALPGKSIFPVIGNHEMHPTNLFSIGELTLTEDFLNVFKSSWKDVAKFSKQDLDNIGKGGFYSKLIKEGLRVLSFNSNYMYTFNIYNVLNHEKLVKPEARETHRFVERELKSAADKGEKVILVFHHPPGGSDFIISQSVWVENLVLKYSDTIVLTVHGHTHNDEFRLVYDKAGKPASVHLITPSVDARGVINPSMRIFHLDSKTFQLLDYEQHYLDLKALAGLKKEQVNDYNMTEYIKKSYSAKKEYDMNDLTPASFHELTKKMESDTPTFLKYLNHYTSKAVEVTDIGKVEKKMHLCRLRNVHHDKVKACMVKKP